MPKQRTPGRPNKHARTAKLLITTFAIAATMAGCAALNAQADLLALFAPAIVVNIDDLAPASSADSHMLTLTNQHAPDNDHRSTQPLRRSAGQMR